MAIVQSSDIVSVDLMDEEHALSLLEKKLGDSYVQDEIVELARELEYMPLAIVQAAEYIRHPVDCVGDMPLPERSKTVC